MSHICVVSRWVLFIISNFYGLKNERLVSIFKSRCYENKHVEIVTQNDPGTSPNTRTFVHVFNPRKLPSTEVVPFLETTISPSQEPKDSARCVLKAVRHHRHRHHCLLVSSPCHMSNINGMIMSGRTQLCKGAVGSFRHVFWVFLGLFAIQTIQFEHA